MAKWWSWGFYIPKVHPYSSKKQKCEKNKHIKRLRFSLNTNKYKYPKIVHSKSPVHGHDPKFLFPHRYKTVHSVYNKPHLSGAPTPKFEANMNYILPIPPSSTKQCNKVLLYSFIWNYF